MDEIADKDNNLYNIILESVNDLDEPQLSYPCNPTDIINVADGHRKLHKMDQDDESKYNDNCVQRSVSHSRSRSEFEVVRMNKRKRSKRYKSMGNGYCYKCYGFEKELERVNERLNDKNDEINELKKEIKRLREENKRLKF